MASETPADRPKAPAAPTRTLAHVLGQSERVHDLVEEAAAELTTVNAGLQQELAESPPSSGVEHALVQSEAVQEKVEDASGQLVAVNEALTAEIDRRRVLEQRSLESAEKAKTDLAAIVDSSDDAIIGKDLEGVITSWNKGAEKIFGYTAEEMVGASITRLIPADRHSEQSLILAAVKRGEGVEHFETIRLTKDGRQIHVSVTASPIKDAAGQIIGVSKIARDMTAIVEAEARERVQLEQRLSVVTAQGEASRIAALHDPLTGLPNRTLFGDRLEHGLAQARRHRWKLAVMFVDLDAFKRINDTHGHDAGDAVLRTIAARLKENVRADDTVSRFGGDEFLYLLMEYQDIATAAQIAEHLLKLIQTPCVVLVQGKQLRFDIRASLGIAQFPKDGGIPGDLIAAADKAMYAAKSARSGYAFAGGAAGINTGVVSRHS